MRYYRELARIAREDGFEVVVDITDEDLHPKECFETDDVGEICRKIDDGTYEWFMLRVRVLIDSHEMGSHYLGGCCYEDPREVLTDGTADDCINEAIAEARRSVRALKEKLASFAD